MSYFSNVSITQSNVYSNISVAEYSDLSVDEQANYLECNYYSSNTIGYYSNLMIYDGINVYANISSNAYNQLNPELQSGYTPVVEYSNVTTTDSPHHYVKVIKHYSNLSVANITTHSNIDANVYNSLLNVKPSYTVFRKYVPTGYFEISLQDYISLSLEKREEYVAQVIPEFVLSNLQPYYTKIDTSDPLPEDIIHENQPPVNP